MTSFADCPVDSNAILDDIERIVRIESPTSDPGGVNRVLDVSLPGSKAPAHTSSAAGSTIGSATCCACAAIPTRPSPASSC